MATLILRPNGNGDVIELTPDPVVDNYLNVDEEVADDNTTDNGYSGESWAVYDLYTLENSSDLGTINSVTVYSRVYTAGGGAGSSGSRGMTKIKTGGTEYDGTLTQGVYSWVTLNTEYVDNPQTTVAWTWDDINALQAGAYIEGSAEGSVSASVTQVYIEVDYTEATGTNTQINIGDSWKEISAAKVNIGDTWKEVAGMQVNVGDAWKNVF